jgi:mevalonate kinase
MCSRVTVSAPGKVTLFGEHAIVYGYPAIVASINRRVYVTASPRNDSSIKIIAKDLRTPGLIITYKDGGVEVTTDYERSLSAMAYLNKSVELTSKYVGRFKGVDLIVSSEMPVGAGLGTSAAVSVATVYAYSRILGYELTKEEIAKIAWNVEKEVQGIASPMDTSISTFGGFLKLWGDGKVFHRERINVDMRLPLVIAYVERKASTKDMVLKVRKLLSRHTSLVKGVMNLIGEVTKKAEKALRDEDLYALGELMNINQGLLDALGVSDMRLSELVYIAREAGAIGSKLTGAGGGGAIIALTPERRDSVEVALRLRASKTMKVDLGGDGVRIEEDNQ